jgi:uncharacterized membrane protein YqgA involved in biofilm formation
MTGTWLNVATVVLGTGLGVLIGRHISDRLRQTAFATLGLITLLIGLQMALKTEQILVPMLALLIGGLMGEGLRLEERLAAIGERLSGGHSRVSQAFMTASLLFCVGAMVILGALEEGLKGTFEIYAVKAMLDGVASIAFASALGWGVGLAAIPILVVQGGLTLAAARVEPFLTQPVLTELTATGGLMLVALALGMLEIKRLPVANFLPALALAPLLGHLSAKLPL